MTESILTCLNIQNKQIQFKLSMQIPYRGASGSHTLLGTVVCKNRCLADTPVHHGVWALTEERNTRNWKGLGKKVPASSSQSADRNAWSHAQITCLWQKHGMSAQFQLMVWKE